MKKKAALLLALALALALTACGKRQEKPKPDGNTPETEESAPFAGGTGTEEDPYLIATASDLAAVAGDLSACYRLDADIDLSGVDWTPIGTYTHTGNKDADNGTVNPDLPDPDIPDEANAFTGIFDGGSHTISNLTVGAADGYCVGLFGCIANAHIYNLTLDSVTVDGERMAGAVAGYTYNSRLTAVSLTGTNTITGYNGEGRNAEMIGGMLGRGKDSLIDSCAARARIILMDGARNAGILCGDLETSSVINGYATGTLTAGTDCYGLGGISGSAFGSEEVINCTAENVRIVTGDNARMVGGLLGYAGGYEDETYGIPVTAVSRCTVNGVEIATGKDPAAVGRLVGGGFYLDEMASIGAPYDTATVFTVQDCTVTAVINGEETTGTAQGTEPETPPDADQDAGQPEQSEAEPDEAGPEGSQEAAQFEQPKPAQSAADQG